MSYTTLVSTKILEQNLDDSNWVIFDCRASLFDHDAGRRAYDEGHIPSSYYCALENDLSSEITATTGRHPLPDFDIFIKKLEEWGIANNPRTQSQVVVYDDAGGAIAVRFWWQLRALGHTKVAVLDGGIPKWKEEGRTLITKIQNITQDIAKAKFIAKIDNNTWLSTEQVEQNLRSKSFVILDARTPERYRGEDEPIDPIAGRIPSSINHAFQLNLDENGLFLSADKLRQQFESIIKQAPEQSVENIVHLCGSGVTACHNMLAMEIAGLIGSRLYAGSWSEWIRDKNRPISVG